MLPSQFRCEVCEHGGNLRACAAFHVEGALRPDGEVEESYTEQVELFEASIQCSVHADGRIEKLIGGVWHRWQRCEAECIGGKIHRPAGDYYRARTETCSVCGGTGGADVPVKEAVAS